MKVINQWDPLKERMHTAVMRERALSLSLYYLSFKGATGNRSEDWEGMETDFAGRPSKGERHHISSQKWDPTDHYS